MGLKKLRVQAKAKDSRGSADASGLIDLCDNNWDAIQEAFNAGNEEEQGELMAHFDSAVDGQEIGQALFGGDKEDFKSKMETLNDEELKAFVEATKASELIADFV